VLVELCAATFLTIPCSPSHAEIAELLHDAYEAGKRAGQTELIEIAEDTDARVRAMFPEDDA